MYIHIRAGKEGRGGEKGGGYGFREDRWDNREGGDSLGGGQVGRGEGLKGLDFINSTQTMYNQPNNQSPIEKKNGKNQDNNHF